MSDQQSQRKLSRLLSFYEKELKIVQADFATQNAVVMELKNEIQRRKQQFDDEQRQLADVKATVANRQQGIHWLDSLERTIQQRRSDLVPAEELCETKRQTLIDQMAKIESMEKLIQRKAVEIDYAARRTEQNESDDQYLISKSGEDH